MSQRRGLNRKEDQSEVQEEREIWSRITSELKKLRNHEGKITDVKKKIDTLDDGMKQRPSAPSSEIEELMQAHKQMKALSDDEIRMLNHLIEQDLSVLQGLRKATEQGIGGSAGPTRDNVAKRKRNETVALETPSGRSKPPRSASVPGDGGLVLHVGSQVAFRLPKQKGTEGEWIQCDVINIIGEGIKRKYEVQDPEPDENGNHGQTYRTGGSQLIPIPKESAGLPVYPVGKQVLARYPETTTFYKAEVIGTKRDGTCRLKFEGEEEVGKETEVERRLVLEFAGK